MEKDEIEKLAKEEYHDEYYLGLPKSDIQVKAFVKGYQKAQQEAKIIEGMKMDEKQTNKGVCKDCYYAGSFTCKH
jgi:hypothetical protein